MPDASSRTTITLNPSAPTSRIWPLGTGAVVIALGCERMKDTMLLFAVPDHLQQEEWKDAVADVEEVASCEGPWLAITFTDKEAVERFIGHLEELKSSMD